MKIKTSELTGPALDWAVHTATGRASDGKLFSHLPSSVHYYPASSHWNIGGRVMERERIIFDYHDSHPSSPDDVVHARLSRARLKPDGCSSWYATQRGPTVLIAAMRCYVASKLGNEVDIPEELL